MAIETVWLLYVASFRTDSSFLAAIWAILSFFFAYWILPAVSLHFRSLTAVLTSDQWRRRCLRLSESR